MNLLLYTNRIFLHPEMLFSFCLAHKSSPILHHILAFVVFVRTAQLMQNGGVLAPCLLEEIVAFITLVNKP